MNLSLLIFLFFASYHCFFFDDEITNPVVLENIKATETRQECVEMCQQSNHQIQLLCKSDTCQTYGIDREIECNKACRLQKFDQSAKDVRDKALDKVFEQLNCDKEKKECLDSCPKRKEPKCEDDCEKEYNECKNLKVQLDTIEKLYKEEQKKKKEEKEAKSKLSKEGEQIEL